MTYLIVAHTYTWWRGDPLPALPPLPALRCRRSVDVALLAALHDVEPAEMEARFKDGNSAYVAFVDDEPAAYGWTASKRVGVIEAGIDWPLSPIDRGLWHFATLEPFRGRGIYPRLLQAILRAEASEAERFWIGHRADNNASKRGIVKAGFQPCTTVLVTPEFQPRSLPRGDRARALEDPQGKHFGFIEAAGEELKPFDFANMVEPPPPPPPQHPEPSKPAV